MRPLEITHRVITNWSGAETAALAIAIKQATEARIARTPDQFTDDLIAYARLCGLGFIQPASETALNPGDFLDQVITHIAKRWPRQTPTSPTVPSTTTKP